jgi:hypothetical protein
MNNEITFTPDYCNAICAIHLGEFEFLFDYIGGGYVPQSNDWNDGKYFEECFSWFVTNPDLNLYEDAITDKTDIRILDNILSAMLPGEMM